MFHEYCQVQRRRSHAALNGKARIRVRDRTRARQRERQTERERERGLRFIRAAIYSSQVGEMTRSDKHSTSAREYTPTQLPALPLPLPRCSQQRSFPAPVAHLHTPIFCIYSSIQRIFASIPASSLRPTVTPSPNLHGTSSHPLNPLHLLRRRCYGAAAPSLGTVSCASP